MIPLVLAFNAVAIGFAVVAHRAPKVRQFDAGAARRAVAEAEDMSVLDLGDETEPR